jgi:hypothetical protein
MEGEVMLDTGYLMPDKAKTNALVIQSPATSIRYLFGSSMIIQIGFIGRF